MKISRYLCLFLLCWPLVASANRDILNKEITLIGEYSFRGIIDQARQQHGFRFEFPHSPDDESKQYYDDTISVEQLLHAIKQYYEDDGMKVEWTIANKDILVREKRKHLIKPPVIQPPKIEKRYDEPPLLEPEKPKHYERPDWVKNRNPSLKAIDLDDTSDVNKKEEGFRVVIPSDKNQKPTTVGTDINKVTPVSRPSISPARDLSIDTDIFSTPNKKKLRVTPYPEDAVAFINDAPSITPTEGPEKFVEWESRMKGAVNQGNRRALLKERDELERRIMWLQQRLR